MTDDMTDDIIDGTTGELVAGARPTECADVARLGPTPADGLLRARAARVAEDAAVHRDTWTHGLTRRGFLARVGIAGAATLSAPLVLNRPANGAGMPPNVSHGVEVDSVCSDARAASGVTGAGLLPPSMYTRPHRSLAPDLPWKSQVAYAVVIEPPSE